MEQPKKPGDPVRGDAKNQAGIGLSSGSGTTPSPPLDSDSPTLIELPQQLSDLANAADLDATFVDADATMADVIPRSKQSPPVRRQSRPQVSTPMLEPGDILGHRY